MGAEEDAKALAMAQKVTFVILSNIAVNLDKTAEAFGAFVGTIHRDNEARIEAAKSETNAFVDTLIDTITEHKVTRMAAILACIATARQLLEMLIRDIVTEQETTGQVKQ
jgi:hypothetical protein